MKKNLCGRLLEYGRACRCELKDTGWGMKLVVLVITGFFCGALATEYFGNRIYFFSGGVILSDMLLVGIVCLFSRIGDRIWHRNIRNILYGIAGALIFVFSCVYGSVGNEHMVSTFFATLIYILLLLSGRFIWAWLVKRHHTPFCGIHFAAGCVIWCVFLVFLFCYSVVLCQAAAVNVSAGLKIPMSVPYACMPIGAVLMILTSIEVIMKQLAEIAELSRREA